MIEPYWLLVAQPRPLMQVAPTGETAMESATAIEPRIAEKWGTIGFLYALFKECGGILLTEYVGGRDNERRESNVMKNLHQTDMNMYLDLFVYCVLFTSRRRLNYLR